MSWPAITTIAIAIAGGATGGAIAWLAYLITVEPHELRRLGPAIRKEVAGWTTRKANQ